MGPWTLSLSISRAPDYLQIHRLIPTSNSEVACVDMFTVKPIRRFRPYTHIVTTLQNCVLHPHVKPRNTQALSDAEHGRPAGQYRKEITWAHYYTAKLSPRAQDGDGQSI